MANHSQSVFISDIEPGRVSKFTETFPLAGTKRDDLAYDRYSCVCGTKTYATCKECGETCCGNCLGSQAHEQRWH